MCSLSLCVFVDGFLVLAFWGERFSILFLDKRKCTDLCRVSDDFRRIKTRLKSVSEFSCRIKLFGWRVITLLNHFLRLWLLTKWIKIFKNHQNIHWNACLESYFIQLSRQSFFKSRYWKRKINVIVPAIPIFNVANVIFYFSKTLFFLTSFSVRLIGIFIP